MGNTPSRQGMGTVAQRSHVSQISDSWSHTGPSQVPLVVQNPPAHAGDQRDTGSIPGSGRRPGGGHGNPHPYLAWRIPGTEERGGLQP